MYRLVLPVRILGHPSFPPLPPPYDRSTWAPRPSCILYRGRSGSPQVLLNVRGGGGVRMRLEVCIVEIPSTCPLLLITHPPLQALSSVHLLGQRSRWPASGHQGVGRVQTYRQTLWSVYAVGGIHSVQHHKKALFGLRNVTSRILVQYYAS